MYRAHYKIARFNEKLKLKQKAQKENEVLHMDSSASHSNIDGQGTQRKNQRYAPGASGSSNSGPPQGDGDDSGVREQSNPPTKDSAPRGIIRMEQLNMEEYRGFGDTEEERQTIQKLFDRQAAARQNKHLDGIKMISEFVAPNRMTQWKVSNKAKRLREECIKESYAVLQRLKEKGKLDHIPIPPSSMEQALLREGNANKYQFAGLLDDMKALTLDQLDDVSQRYKEQRQRNGLSDPMQRTLQHDSAGFGAYNSMAVERPPPQHHSIKKSSKASSPLSVHDIRLREEMRYM